MCLIQFLLCTIRILKLHMHIQIMDWGEVIHEWKFEEETLWILINLRSATLEQFQLTFSWLMILIWVAFLLQVKSLGELFLSQSLGMASKYLNFRCLFTTTILLKYLKYCLYKGQLKEEMKLHWLALDFNLWRELQKLTIKLNAISKE